MNSSRRACGGFTLIEVLVALAVVVVSFLAMYGSAQQVVGNMTLQQEKTFASWVAFDQLTELRLAEQLPTGERLSGEIDMADIEWRYVVEFNDLGDERWRQVVVEVSPADDPDRVLAQAMSVLLTTGRRPGSGNSGSSLITSAGGGAGDELQGVDTDGDGIADLPPTTTLGGGFDDVIDDATGSEN